MSERLWSEKNRTQRGSLRPVGLCGLVIDVDGNGVDFFFGVVIDDLQIQGDGLDLVKAFEFVAAQIPQIDAIQCIRIVTHIDPESIQAVNFVETNVLVEYGDVPAAVVIYKEIYSALVCTIFFHTLEDDTDAVFVVHSQTAGVNGYVVFGSQMHPYQLGCGEVFVGDGVADGDVEFQQSQLLDFATLHFVIRENKATLRFCAGSDLAMYHSIVHHVEVAADKLAFDYHILVGAVGDLHIEHRAVEIIGFVTGDGDFDAVLVVQNGTDKARHRLGVIIDGFGGSGGVLGRGGVLAGAGCGENHHQNQQNCKQNSGLLCHNNLLYMLFVVFLWMRLYQIVEEKTMNRILKHCLLQFTALQHITHIQRWKLS